MTSRERRSWTEAEDNLLRSAVQWEDADSYPPTKWRAIAKHIPDRNNKDCRKRWFAKMASPVARGGWSADEDDRLVKAIQKFGTKWSLVAATVGTRNNNQCAKRWSDTLSPDIDKTSWTPEEDLQLLAAVVKHGTLWAQIVKMYFPGRTGLSAKNRHARLSRMCIDPVDGDRHHHHAYRQRSSPSSCRPLVANRSPSQLQPETWHSPSASCSDTTSTPGSSSSLVSERPSSQTPDQECPRSVDNVEHDSSGLQTTSFQFPPYGLAGTTEQTDKALVFANSDLFWDTSPSTFTPDFLHTQSAQPQGLTLHPYEAISNDVRFVPCNPCPSRMPQLTSQSQSPGPRLFGNQSSLYPQSAYNIPSTIYFSHTPQLTFNTPNIHDTYTNDIRELPPPSSTLPLPSFPLLHTGTPNSNLPVKLSIHKPIEQVNEPVVEFLEKLGDDVQDLSLFKQVADPSSSGWNLSNPYSCTLLSTSDADVGFTMEMDHSNGDSRVTMAPAPHGERVTVAVALCDYKDVQSTVQSLVQSLRR